MDLEIRRLAELFTRRIEKLNVAGDGQEKELDLRVVRNLRDCVQSAATVVSSASTVLGVGLGDRSTIHASSEYGDLFPRPLGDTMQRWVAAKTEHSYEAQDISSVGRFPSVRGGRVDSDSESDTELDIDIIRSLFKRGQDAFAAKRFEAAEKTLQNCLSRAETLENRHPARPISMEHRFWIPTSQLLIHIYVHQCRWDDAQTILVKNLSLHGKVNSKESRHDLETLVEVLLRRGDFTAAHRYARQLLKAYRRLRGCEPRCIADTLRLLVGISRQDAKPDQEEAYNAMLVDMAEGLEAPKELPLVGIEALTPVMNAYAGPGFDFEDSQQRRAISMDAAGGATQRKHGGSSSMKNDRESSMSAESGTPTPTRAGSDDVSTISNGGESDIGAAHTTPLSWTHSASAPSTPRLHPSSPAHPPPDSDEFFDVSEVSPKVHTGWSTMMGRWAEPHAGQHAVSSQATTRHSSPATPVPSTTSADIKKNPSDVRMTGTIPLTLVRKVSRDQARGAEESPPPAMTLSIPQQHQVQDREVDLKHEDDWSGNGARSTVSGGVLHSPTTPTSASVTDSSFSPVFDGSSDGGARSTATPLTAATSVDDSEKVLTEQAATPEISHGQVRQRIPEFAYLAEDVPQQRQSATRGIHDIVPEASPKAFKSPVEKNGRRVALTLDELPPADLGMTQSTQTASPRPPANILTDSIKEETAPSPNTSQSEHDIAGQAILPSQHSTIAKRHEAVVEPLQMAISSFTGRVLPLHGNGYVPALSTSSYREPAATRRNLCCIGDGCSGKTALLQRAGQDRFREGTGPTIYQEAHLVRVEIDAPANGWVDLTLTDNGSCDVCEVFWAQSLKECHIVVIAFDLSDFSLMSNVEDNWAVEAAKYAPGTPVIIAGCHSDRIHKHDDRITKNKQYEATYFRCSEAQKMCKKIGAVAYFETSALTGEGVSELMRRAASIAQSKTGQTPAKRAQSRSQGFATFRRSLHSRVKSIGTLQELPA